MDSLIDGEHQQNLNEWIARCNQTQSVKRKRLPKTDNSCKLRKKDYVSINIHNEDNVKISRPPNAFMIFGKETRKLLAQKFPQFSNKQISKLLGQQWKGLDNESKTHYHCMAEEAAQMHRIKYPDYKYNANELHRQKEAKKALKKSNDKNKEHKNIANFGNNDKRKINNESSSFTPDLCDSDMSEKEEEVLEVKPNIITEKYFGNRNSSANNEIMFDNSCGSDVQFRVKKRVLEVKNTPRKSLRNKELNLMPRNIENTFINYKNEQFNNINSTNLFSFDNNEMVEEIDVKPDINTLIGISNEANNMDMCSKTDEIELNCRESNLIGRSVSRDYGDKCVKATLIECGNCDQVFQQLNELMLHISNEHNTASANLVTGSSDNNSKNIAEVDQEKIPRPPNSFMIFGKERRKLLAQTYPQYSNKQISKILGQQWKSLTVEMKMHYHGLAEQAVQLHRIKYPDYYYSPIEARRRKANKKLMSKPRKKISLSNTSAKISNSNAIHSIETKKLSETRKTISLNNITHSKSSTTKNADSVVNKKDVIPKTSRNRKQDMTPKNNSNTVIITEDERHIPHSLLTHLMDKRVMIDEEEEEDNKPDITDNTEDNENDLEVLEKRSEKDLNVIENKLVDNGDDNAIESMILECGNCDKVFHQLNEFMAHISSEHNTVSSDNLDKDMHMNNAETDEEEGIEEKIPRPPNSFMIFGKEKRKLLAQKYPQYSNKQISKVLGQQWKSLTVEMKKHYHCLAQEAVKEHRIKYPDYYYNPFEARRRKAEMKMMKKYRRKKNISKKLMLKSGFVQTDDYKKSAKVLNTNQRNIAKSNAEQRDYDLRPNRMLSHEKLNGFIHLRPKIIDLQVTHGTLKNVGSNAKITSQNIVNDEIIVAKQANEITEKNSDIYGESVSAVKRVKQSTTHSSLNSGTPVRRSPQFKCVYCEKRFCSPEAVQNHHRLFHRIKNQPIECNVSYNATFSCDNTQRKRADRVLFKCNKCDYKSKSMNEVTEHTKTVHIEKRQFHTHSASDNRCDVSNCGKRFINVHGLRSENSYIHSTRNLPFMCDWPDCGATFKLKAVLAVHMRSHSRSNAFIRARLKYFKCDECDYMTGTKKMLSSHQIRIHQRNLSRDDVGCDVEPNSRHMFTHLEEIPFNCEWPHCGASFKSFRSLKFHMKIHET